LSSNPYSFIGESHNAVCEFLISHGSKNLQKSSSNDISLNDYNNIVSLSLQYASVHNYDSVAVQAMFNSIHQLFIEADIFYQEDGTTYLRNLFTKINDLSNAAINLGTVDSMQINEVQPIIDAAINGASKTELAQMVNQLPLSTYDPQTMGGVLAFISTFNSSNEFWDSLNEGSLLKPNSDSGDVIIADAWGALYGMIWGPAGSIIGGAAFSYLINENT